MGWAKALYIDSLYAEAARDAHAQAEQENKMVVNSVTQMHQRFNDMNLPQAAQDILDATNARLNAAIANNTVPELLTEMRAQQTPETNAQIDRAVHQVMNRVNQPEPFTGTPHKINESE